MPGTIVRLARQLLQLLFAKIDGVIIRIGLVLHLLHQGIVLREAIQIMRFEREQTLRIWIFVPLARINGSLALKVGPGISTLR